MSEDPQIIETEKMPLDEWLLLVFNPPDDTIFINYQFPTEKHREEYLATIHNRDDEEVRKLLRMFLVQSGSLGIDEDSFKSLITIQKSAPERFEEMMEFERRLVLYVLSDGKVLPWEGITWVLDLLPHFPKEALEGLSAYMLAHIQYLPDGRATGLYDASEIIRAKYIGIPIDFSGTIRLLMSISPREFEHIIERLYSAMGYETILTPPQKDGGRDIIAKKSEPGKLEYIQIECKRYSKPVGVETMRALLGVISDERVNKGVLVTTNRFTKGAKDFANRNPQLELIVDSDLISLLNEHLGARWSLQIERLITESQRHNSTSDNQK